MDRAGHAGAAARPSRPAQNRSAASVLVDVDGRANYLAAAWRRPLLENAIASLPDVADASMRALYAWVSIIEVPDPDGWGTDIDTIADLGQARGTSAAS